VIILDATQKVIWEHPAALVHDAWMLPNGNVLFADGRAVTEVTRDHKVVFQYTPTEQRGGSSYACQRLANGNTMIGENSTGRVLEVDGAGKIVFEMQTTPFTPGAHHNMRMVRKLESGNYLVCHSGAHVVKEYTPAGKVVREIPTSNVAFAALRTSANTTLVSTLDRIYEYDDSGKVVWQFANSDIPDTLITNMTGMHLLPGGNIAVGCYSAYKDKQGTGLFEITRDRKLVWRYSNPAADKSLMSIQYLDGSGKALTGKCVR
jgi:prepilin-type processing-associated H-X9-DG protein